MSFYSPFSNSYVAPTYTEQGYITNTYEQPVLVSETTFKPPVTVYGQAAVYKEPKTYFGGKNKNKGRWFWNL